MPILDFLAYKIYVSILPYCPIILQQSHFIRTYYKAMHGGNGSEGLKLTNVTFFGSSLPGCLFRDRKVSGSLEAAKEGPLNQFLTQLLGKTDIFRSLL